MSETKTPQQGVIAIITDPKGRGVTNAADFEVGASAGFRQREMQERRAVNQAWRNVITSGCNAEIAAAILATNLDLQNIRRQLQLNGWTQTVTPIGY